MIKDIKQVIQFIHSANSEDTDLIVQAIKYRRNQLHSNKAQSFKIGDVVSFKGRYNRQVSGTVQKIKIKYVHVDCGPHGKWNVPGNHLTLVKETA
jgi:hypothetical protein|tara:strand:- start:476 stop:760 length:285 start_codon:yes stop_codon:yes gene_type:complete